MEIRKSSRGILLNENNEVFLIKETFRNLRDGQTLWVTPGGGAENGESYESCLKRELKEELGLSLSQTPQCVFSREMVFRSADGTEFLSKERYYLVRIGEEPMSFDGLTERETADVQARRWWSAEELDASEETFFADHLPQRIRAALHAGEWELPLPI